MKIRNGFVSNSSSSSFVIPLKNITNKQLKMIKSYEVKAKKLRLKYWDSPWEIKIENEFVYGYTDMDNFDMEYYLESVVKIPNDKIRWG